MSLASSSAHRARVFLLYKRSLRTLLDWAIDRPLFNTEARKLRAEFEEHRNETDVAKINFLVQRAEHWLKEYQHTEPYTIPANPGGSAYLRNEPLPEHIVKLHSKLTDADSSPHH